MCADTAETADSRDTAGRAGRRSGKAGGGRLVPRGVWLTGAAFFAVEMAVSARYGFHRDELYFLAAGRHPAWGYIDQPPLAPVLTRLATAVFGNSPSAIRAMSALAGGAVVVVAGLIARLLGGGRAAALLTAIAVACAPVTLAATHLANTTSYDMLTWAAIIALTLMAVLQDRPKLWLAVGAVTGLGLENKDLPLLLVIALLAGLVSTGRWRALRTPWLLAGAVVALALWAPNLAWQATHGWPALIMSRKLQAEHSGIGDYLTVVPAELLYLGLAAVPLAFIGAARLMHDRSLRFLGIATLLVLAYIVLDVPGRPYYADGLLPVIFAAGAVTVESRVSGQGALAGWLLAPIVGAVAGAVLILPVLPVSAIGHLPFLHKLNYDMGETVGWPRLVSDIAGIYGRLPPGQRGRTSIFTGNYGEAGAIAWYGPALGLPVPLSGNNNYWLWGPGSAPDDTVIAVGAGPLLRPYFAACVPVTTFHSPHGINNDENGVTISMCTGPRASWTALWPRLRHYG